MDISRTNCIHADCQEPVFYRRLCHAHHKAKYPNENIREYCFHWEIVEEYSAVIKAETRELAREMVSKGMIKGKKNVSSIYIPMPTKIECVKEIIRE